MELGYASVLKSKLDHCGFSIQVRDINSIFQIQTNQGHKFYFDSCLNQALENWIGVSLKDLLVLSQTPVNDIFLYDLSPPLQTEIVGRIENESSILFLNFK